MKKLLLFSALLMISFLSLTTSQYVPNGWTQNGSEVYYEDSRVHIAATAVSNEPVIRLTSKVYTGDINFALGFDTDNVEPLWAGYNPHMENYTRSYTCQGYFNYTTNPNHFWCYKNITTQISTTPNITTSELVHAFNHSFESGNLTAKTAYWTDTKEVWNDVSGAFAGFSYNVAGTDRWWMRQNFPIVQDQEYKLKLQLKQKDFGESHKYWIAFWPSNLNIQQAIQQDKFYALDPWTSDLNTGLDMYYNFDQNDTGGDITEQLLGAYNLTWTSSESWGTGILGASQYVNDAYFSSVTDNDQWEIGENQDFTVNFWVNWDNTATNQWVLYATNETQAACGWIIGNENSANLYWGEQNGQTWSKLASSVSTGTWHMVTAVYDEATTNLTGYLDGDADTSTTIDLSGNECTPGKKIIGANQVGGTPYDGHVDELGKWNRTLTYSEIQTLWNSGVGVTYTPTSTDPPTIVLNTPLNNTETLNNTVIFTVNVTEATNAITNVSLYIDGIINETNTSGYNGTYSFEKNVSFANHTWWANVFDNSSYSANTTNFTISVVPYQVNNVTYEGTVYVSEITNYSINFNSSSTTVTNPLFIYGSNSSTPTITDNGDGSFIMNATRNITSDDLGTNEFSFNATIGGVQYNFGNTNQTVQNLSMYQCGNGSSDSYLHFEFVDEQNLSAVNATINSAIFTYYTTNEEDADTFSFTNLTQQSSYDFCIAPAGGSYYIKAYFPYTGVGYPQRVYESSYKQYSNNTGHNETLYALLLTSGQYVTFQVTNIADQAIADVFANVTRTISGSEQVISSGFTSAAGAITFFLNPDSVYTYYFTKAGYTSYNASFAPTLTEYTINLGASTSTTFNDYFRGIDYSVLPQNSSLVNDTTYSFEFNVTSSYWDLESFGFNLRLANGTIVGTDSSTVAGTPATVSYNVNNQSIIYMDYYWVVDGNYTNATKYWPILNTANTGWSINYFISDLKSYMSAGFFGIDNFGKTFIVFIIIFVSIGIMSYKYGINSPLVVVTIMFGIVFFFDVTVNLIPTIRGIPNLPTYIMGLLVVVMVMKEGMTK